MLDYVSLLVANVACSTYDAPGCYNPFTLWQKYRETKDVEVLQEISRDLWVQRHNIWDLAKKLPPRAKKYYREGMRFCPEELSWRDLRANG
jgi:hypothetical protein